jgi:WS/DGAT/MGAT family acyltransferase
LTSEQPRFERRLSDVDTLTWRIDAHPLLRSHGVHIELLDRAPNWDRLVTAFDRLSRVVPRYRQRIVEPVIRGLNAGWSIDPDFDLAYHVRRVRAPEPGGMAQLVEIAQAYLMTPLDRARPLWEALLVDGLEKGRAALLQKGHHAFLDGAGWLYVLGVMHDRIRNPPPEPLPAEPAPDDLTPSSLAWEELRDGAAEAVRRAPRQAARLLRGIGRAMADPSAATADVEQALRDLAAVLAPAEPSPLLEGISVSRRFALLEVPVEDLRRAAHAAGGTLNDALVAGVAEGFRRYHADFGASPEAMVTAVPINVRREDDPLLGNRIAAGLVNIPLVAGAAERVRRVHEIMLEARAHPVTAVDALAPLLNRAVPPALVQRLSVRLARAMDVGLSNVAGHREPLYLAGAEVMRIFGLPVAVTPIQINLVSHGETCCIGVICDTAAVSDVPLFAARLKEGLDQVLGLGGTGCESVLVAVPAPAPSPGERCDGVAHRMAPIGE